MSTNILLDNTVYVVESLFLYCIRNVLRGDYPLDWTMKKTEIVGKYLNTINV